jgi:hypothetical protein
MHLLAGTTGLLGLNPGVNGKNQTGHASNGLIDMGSRLELFVDDKLVDHMEKNASFRLHHPVARNVALETDKPWEGNMCFYITVFQDDDLYRMYYKSTHHMLTDGEMQESHDMFICYAESKDGIHWYRPELGLHAFQGSKRNNIIWKGVGPNQNGIHGFAPFKDPNPHARPEAKYKAVGAERRAVKGKKLYAMQSPDGIHWSMMQDEPIIEGFSTDSQNLAFWDSVRKEYRAYVRQTRRTEKGARRDIVTATSKDFIHWTEPQLLDYPGAPDEQLYTNQIIPYYRAPHIFLGFPTRYIQREWSPTIEALPETEHRRLRSSVNTRYGTALTDGLFMSSRDGRTYHRWPEAFLRPGPQQQGNWAYGDNYQNWGLVETPSTRTGAPNELSLYATEGYWRGYSTRFRRYTIRIDGFVSVHAPYSGGEMMTKPLIFSGNRLKMNFATSAAGHIRIEVQDAKARPISGFTLEDSTMMIGDSLDYTARWGNRTDVSELAGRPVRLRFVMRDADLFSIRFV